MVWIGEIMVDWIKHSFVTRFNELPYTIYFVYRRVLCGDLTSRISKDSFVDSSHLMNKRMGFVPDPLVALVSKLDQRSQCEIVFFCSS